MKIFIGSDHAGFTLKAKLDEVLSLLGHTIIDVGAVTYNTTDDYPDFVKKVAKQVSEDPENYRGIVIGGSGQGEAMVANRYPLIRCTLFYGPVSAKGEIDIKKDTNDDPYVMLKLSREHNNANMLSLGARFMTEEEAVHAVLDWLSAPFNNEVRHTRRIAKF